MLPAWHVPQLHYSRLVKTATIPSVRVEPTLRAAIEAQLREGESMSEFVENAVRDAVQKRQDQDAFIARGLVSLEEAKRTGKFIEADVVIRQLQEKLAAARARAAKKR
jgi:Arc/MetJ-type ribon-helix-helix transcriptional regulator